MGRAGWVFALVAVTTAVVLGGCGDDDDSTGALGTATAPGDDVASIETVVGTWILGGDCQLMTDEFLAEQAGDPNPETACTTFRSQFVAPGYESERFEMDITERGTTAKVEVKISGTSVSSTYFLVKDGDTWKIDAANF